MIKVKVLYNDNNEELYCSNSKERIQLGQKYALLVVDCYDGTTEEIPFLLDNLPTEDETEE